MFEGAQLQHAVNDATEIAAIFRRFGYDVFEKLNIKSEDCSNILSSFEDSDLVKIHSNVSLHRLAFAKEMFDEDLF